MVKPLKSIYARLRKAEIPIDLLQKYGLEPNQLLIKVVPDRLQLSECLDTGKIVALEQQAATEFGKMEMTAREDANNDAYQAPADGRLSQSEQLYIDHLLVLYQSGRVIFESAKSKVKARIQQGGLSVDGYDKDARKVQIEEELLVFRKMDGQPHITLGQCLDGLKIQRDSQQTEYRKFNAQLGNMEANVYCHKPPVQRMFWDYPAGYAATIGTLGIWEGWINLDAALESDFIGGNFSKVIVVVIFGAGMATATHMLGSGYHFKDKKAMVTGGAIGGLLFIAVTSLRIAAAKFDPVIFVVTILLFLLGILCAIARSQHEKYWGLKDKVDSIRKKLNEKQGQFDALGKAVEVYAEKSSMAELDNMKQTQKLDEGILEDLEKSFLGFREKMRELANGGLVSYRYNYFDQLRWDNKSIDTSNPSQPPLVTDMDMGSLPSPKGDASNGLPSRGKNNDTPPEEAKLNHDK